ncbi:MarR family winged helix-turn-helix transcriptional regulator [Desulfocurvus sp.]|uniref:MarR family winged helix-turn-helix transcriptional regulator n=1 Tax=Desulfocurvus sp. TaxID=2871698 RepID=UPI0025BA6646|nr:MarR family winged helix-turn-helix transcriptional regulator [Desulfocurvus sp.]MCK9240396.1 MarR family winged helix-turn-helix transcriptional regulator [Desulfocurvus sp.]
MPATPLPASPAPQDGHGADPALVDAMNQALHALIRGLRLHRLDSWDATLKGLNFIDLGIIARVDRDPDLILKDIRTALGVPQSTLSSAVSRLEERGILRRTLSTRDRRSYGLALTAKGRRIVRAHEALDQVLAAKVLAALDDEEQRRALTDLLGRAARRLSGGD